MKNLIIIFLFCVTANIFGQTLSSGIKINIEEKIKSDPGKQSVINELVIIVLNDSTKYELTTDNEGCVSIKNLPAGRYNVKVLRVGCRAYEIKGVILGEGKTAYISFRLTCELYINSLTKREKRKLGYKISN